MADGKKGRAEGQRLKLFYLLDYLLENTDMGIGHTVKTSQIIDHLDKYNIPVEKKTVWSDIRVLQDYGVEIEYDYKEQAYRVIQREFELHELQLLIDSVQSSKFITQKMAKTLTDKLKKQASRYDRITLDRRCYVVNRVRSMNDSVFYHIDDIHDSIKNDWQIEFKYFGYDIKKKKQYFKKGELYHASPFALLWNDDNYYLLAYESGKLKHFRVDKMDDIKIAFVPREGKKEFADMKLTERSLKVFSMYGGKEERVQIHFSNRMAGVVMDRFGKDVLMVPVDDRHFGISVAVEVSPQFFAWVFGLGKSARIVGPEHVVQEMRDYIQKVAEMY